MRGELAPEIINNLFRIKLNYPMIQQRHVFYYRLKPSNRDRLYGLGLAEPDFTPGSEQEPTP